MKTMLSPRRGLVYLVYMLIMGPIIDALFAVETVRPRKRMRTDPGQIRDKFNLSNDHFYEVAKEGGRHRVRQTFGQLVVEHAYPAQKLQLPFVSLSGKFLDYFSTFFVVQNSTIKTGSSFFPPTCLTISFKYRTTIQ